MIKINNIEIKSGNFPNGETYVDLPNEIMATVRATGAYHVDFKFESNQDIWNLMQIADRLKQKNCPRYLKMDYVPYSRMDRSEESRLFSLKTFANLINSMNFDSVTIMEPHSDVTPALFDRLVVRDMSARLAWTLLKQKFGIIFMGDNIDEVNQQMAEKKICFVWPDGGAEKRYGKQIKCRNTMTVGKARDFNSGRVETKYVIGAEDHQDCEYAIIVDDLCSRGGTFIGAAKKLRENLPNLKKVYLVVTHCENTIADGEIFTTDLIDAVYTTDSILNTERVSHHKLYVTLN